MNQVIGVYFFNSGIRNGWFYTLFNHYWWQEIYVVAVIIWICKNTFKGLMNLADFPPPCIKVSKQCNLYQTHLGKYNTQIWMCRRQVIVLYRENQKIGYYRDVAVVERWHFVKVTLYMFQRYVLGEIRGQGELGFCTSHSFNTMGDHKSQLYWESDSDNWVETDHSRWCVMMWILWSVMRRITVSFRIYTQPWNLNISLLALATRNIKFAFGEYADREVQIRLHNLRCPTDTDLLASVSIITKAKIKLCEFALWSGSLLFAHATKASFIQDATSFQQILLLKHEALITTTADDTLE